MSNKISFGKHDGKTFEWLFFNAPGYPRWLYEQGAPHQDHFGTEESEYFLNLYDRACNLGGTCNRCTNQVTRMGLTWQRSGALGAVDFYCDDCEYQGGSVTAYHPASFFVEAHEMERGEQKMILTEIKRHYIGTGNLTQRKMEAFFRNHQNFSLPATIH